MSDEEIIKRKLLIDGDGTGDDRRLNVISKSLKKWISSIQDNPVENQATQDKLLAQLCLCEYSVKRSQLLSKIVTKQLNHYNEIQEDFEKQIQNVKHSIMEGKENLKQAKTWKQNHMMYDLLAQSICEQPARKETDERLQNLQAELKQLSEEKEQLEQKLDQKTKQFHVLISSANKLVETVLGDSDKDIDFNEDLLGPEPMSE